MAFCLRASAPGANARIAANASRSARHRPAALRIRASAIRVERSPSQEQLDKLGVKRWPTWGCGVSKFPWTYDGTETSYILEGKVVVTPDGGAPVEIQAGDLCVFPSGMSCTWDVKQPIKKHYNFS